MTGNLRQLPAFWQAFFFAAQQVFQSARQPKGLNSSQLPVCSSCKPTRYTSTHQVIHPANSHSTPPTLQPSGTNAIQYKSQPDGK
jgi:hypothetical protein